MLAGTSKSKEIRQYYLKLEELMQETLNEESEELFS
jgi:phage anti-repressor protein